MFGSVRRYDWVTSLCNKPSGPFVSASSTSFVDGKGQVRLFDSSVPGLAVSGSKSCFVNGRPAVRLKDQVVCGRIKTASTTTFIGD